MMVYYEPDNVEVESRRERLVTKYLKYLSFTF